ncbi:MAG TPA: GNAT family N-acetyltransferase, partial [Burkholderiales bacterium]|nr:GNAT family N-acetyltransferase [Burkholderiales bacterium]
RYFCFGNWYLNVNGRSYQQYFATLPAAVRNTLARKGKQARSKARIEVVTGRDGLQSALAAYHQIYNASWKVPEPSPGFIDGLAAMCADKGWLRLGVLRVDNEPAAAQIWIVSAGTAAIYKLAYDSRFAKLSVGSLLTAHLMEHVIDRDLVREVDYLTGDDGYKKDWMSDRRERFGVSALNRRTVKGLALIARHFAARLVKRALRHQTS